MPLTREEAKFRAAANRIAEVECGGNFDGDESKTALSNLFSEFVARDEVSDSEDWLALRVRKLFRSLNERPAWIEGTPNWPFHDGRPMVFICQHDVCENDVSREDLASNAVIYVFGIRVDVGDGWQMKYSVVDQFRELVLRSS